MSEKSIITVVDNRGVATLTMNRPELHNAFDDRLIADLTDVLRELDEDPDVTGRGPGCQRQELFRRR